MEVSQKFIRENCPCVKYNPCPRRSAECHGRCGEWRDWTRLREEERQRVETAAAAKKYAMEAAVITADRSIKYKNMKRRRRPK